VRLDQEGCVAIGYEMMIMRPTKRLMYMITITIGNDLEYIMGSTRKDGLVSCSTLELSVVLRPAWGFPA